MADQVVWAALSVTNPETGEDLHVKRDEFLPDWVEPFTLFALQTTGAVRHVEDDQEPAPAPATAPVGTSELFARPSTSDTVDMWRTYAVSQGMAQEDASKATKADLVSKYR